MADLTSTAPEAPSAGPSRRMLVFARVRQWLAVGLLMTGAVRMVWVQIEVYRALHHIYSFDPAPLFYLAGAVGLALRVFWARYLAICFMAALMAINFFWAPRPIVAFAIGLPFIALLSGRTMRGLFEERAGRLNHWAAALDRRVARLRILFVAQAVAIGLIFAASDQLSPAAVPVVVAAGLALVGLVFQRTWGVLAIAPVLGLEAYLAARTIGVEFYAGNMPGWSFTAVLFVACGVSLVVIFPMLWAFGRRLRGA